MVSDFDKRNASIKQLTVKKTERRRGFGKALINSYHQQYWSDLTVFKHWVDLNNAPAINMYQAFGYQFHLRKANEYIMLKGE